MPIYIYETIGEPCVQFEVRQSMKDEPLTRHPETGAPVRRVISGGYGILQKSVPAASRAQSSHSGHGCCGGACGCRH